MRVAVLCPPEYREALRPWIAYRQQAGYRIHLLNEPDPSFPIEEKSLLLPAERSEMPLRIRRKIRELNARAPLKAILIVGDAFPLEEREISRIIPSPRVSGAIISHFGSEDHIASDSWYADLDGDGLPELSVGRIPARSPEELKGVIEKIIAYETQVPAGTWQRRIPIVAGIGGMGAIADQAINSLVRKIFTDLLPGGYVSPFTQANWKSSFCPAPSRFRDTVISRINEGALFWVYMGHGFHQGLDLLRTPDGDYPILNEEDIDLLNCSAGPPILLFFACYTGALDAYDESIAEKIALSPKGPIAVLAASRISMPYGLSVLGVELLDTAFAKEVPRTLGDIVRDAKRKMVPLEMEKTDLSVREELRGILDQSARILDPSGRRLDLQLMEHLHSVNLLGDPLLQVRFPGKIEEITAPEITRSGSKIEVRGRIDPDPEWSGIGKPDSEEEVRAELALPRGRVGYRKKPRQEFSSDLKTEQEYQRIYEAANRLEHSRGLGKLSGKDFTIPLEIPENVSGSYIIRIFVKKNGRVYIGSKKLIVRPYDSSRQPPSGETMEKENELFN